MKFKYGLLNMIFGPIKDEKIIEQIKEKYRNNGDFQQLLIFLLSINTGLRVNEVLSLKVKDVKNKTCINIKNGIAVILSEEIRDIISEQVKNKRLNDWLFRTKSDNQMARVQVHRKFREICDELGYTLYSIISWSKTFAYFYYQKTKDIGFLQWYFNQPSAEMALDYIDEPMNMADRFQQVVAL